MDALGIDISKQTFAVALWRDPTYQCASFPNDARGFKQLRHWLQQHQVTQLHACMEATGRYGDALAHVLYAADYQVSVVNPARIKAYAASRLRRNKTDQQDAQVLAHFCATQEPKPWQPPIAAQQILQALVRHRQALQQMRQQERNRLTAAAPASAVQESIQAHLDFLDEQIAQLDQQIEAHIAHHATLAQQQALLVSIPGIATLTAAKLLAELPTLERFSSAPQLAAYAGLTPRQHMSGTSVQRRARLSKQGNIRLRRALYMPALVARRHNPLLRTFADRLQARGKAPKVIVCALMRKLLHLIYGVLKHQRPFDPNYATV